MRHCDKCGVDIMDDVNNCPLCGRDISTENKVESFLCYPDNKVWQSKRNTLISLMFWASIIGMLISIFVEWLIFKHISYNWYVITGVAMFILTVVLPLKFRWSFSFVCLFVGICLCAYILFLELFTNSFGWGLFIAIPFFIMFMSLYSTFVMVLRNYYKGYDFVICLLTFAALSIAVFLYNILSGGLMWPSLVSFLTSVTCFIFILIFRFKSVKKQFEKKFFI